MATNEELQAAWQLFSDNIPLLVKAGTIDSTYAFLRTDIMPDGGMVTHMLAYNMSTQAHLGMVAYQLFSLDKQIQAGSNQYLKHNIQRVLKLFNRLFNAEGQVVNKKDLN